MFKKQPHDKAERNRFFGLSKKIAAISPEDEKLLQNVDKALGIFGASLADQLKVEKLQGPNFTKTDEYIATRPGLSNN